MYTLMPGIKGDPVRRWALPDRIFFGHGACHILAGVYLANPPLRGFYAERIIPGEGFAGNHIYVTDGNVTFDNHGYALRMRLLQYFTDGWSRRSSVGWHCRLERVDFDLLDQSALNERRMLGPDQYLHNPVPRARKFIERLCHERASDKAARSLG